MSANPAIPPTVIPAACPGVIALLVLVLASGEDVTVSPALVGDGGAVAAVTDRMLVFVLGLEVAVLLGVAEELTDRSALMLK